MDVFSCFKLALFMVFKHLPTTILLLLLVAVGVVLALLIPIPMIFVMPGVCCYFWKFPYGADLKKIYGKSHRAKKRKKNGITGKRF